MEVLIIYRFGIKDLVINTLGLLFLRVENICLYEKEVRFMIRLLYDDELHRDELGIVTVFTDDVYDIVKLDTWMDNEVDIEGHYDILSGCIEYCAYSTNRRTLSKFEEFVKSFESYNSVRVTEAEWFDD